MTEAIERYLELKAILNDPNTNISNTIIEDGLDELQAIWDSLSDEEREVIKKFE